MDAADRLGGLAVLLAGPLSRPHAYARPRLRERTSAASAIGFGAAGRRGGRLARASVGLRQARLARCAGGAESRPRGTDRMPRAGGARVERDTATLGPSGGQGRGA